jgi:Uncharacterized conserved protein
MNKLIQQHPHKTKEIVAAAIKADLEKTEEIVTAAIKENLEETEEIVAAAIKANPEKKEGIVEVAIKAKPEKIKEILQKAGISGGQERIQLHKVRKVYTVLTGAYKGLYYGYMKSGKPDGYGEMNVASGPKETNYRYRGTWNDGEMQNGIIEKEGTVTYVVDGELLFKEEKTGGFILNTASKQVMRKILEEIQGSVPPSGLDLKTGIENITEEQIEELKDKIRKYVFNLDSKEDRFV